MPQSPNSSMKLMNQFDRGKNQQFQHTNIILTAISELMNALFTLRKFFICIWSQSIPIFVWKILFLFFVWKRYEPEPGKPRNQIKDKLDPFICRSTRIWFFFQLFSWSRYPFQMTMNVPFDGLSQKEKNPTNQFK